MDRRTFLALFGTGLLVGCGADSPAGAPASAGRATPDGSSPGDRGSPATGPDGAATTQRGPAPKTPNVLVILCDQLRAPAWFPAGIDALLPNLTALRARSVSFGQHFTAAIQCSPARASLLTGLYGRQHFIGKNSAPDATLGPALDPRLPTWGTLFDRLGLGYERRWFGKWHLSNVTASTWATYGFNPGLSNDVAVGDDAEHGDAQTVAAFRAWLDARPAGTPFCTTVSLVNPHDIAHTYSSPGMPAGLTPPSVVDRLPRNYESSAALRSGKPRLQRFFQEAFDAYNPMPLGAATDAATQQAWIKLLDVYVQYQRDVDVYLGQVLDALAASPHADNTIVVFTADHGEHGGSHGLWNKHGTAYDETLRIPLYVADPTGYWTAAAAAERGQLTSSVDVLPMLLTFASGGAAWRSQVGFEHLARRPDLAPILRDPAAAPVRSYILHTSDSIGPAVATLGDGSSAANHVTAIRTLQGKLVFYDVWRNGTANVDPSGGSEVECYDYQTDAGRDELQNVGSQGATFQQLAQLYADEGARELTESFADPTKQAAQSKALAAYWNTAFDS